MITIEPTKSVENTTSDGTGEDVTDEIEVDESEVKLFSIDELVPSSTPLTVPYLEIYRTNELEFIPYISPYNVGISTSDSSDSDSSGDSLSDSDGTGEDGEDGSSSSSGSGGSSSSSGSSGGGSSSSTKNGWYGGQYYVNGKIELSIDYVNSLSPEQASKKYRGGRNTYTKNTLDRLYRRSFGSKVVR